MYYVCKIAVHAIIYIPIQCFMYKLFIALKRIKIHLLDKLMTISHKIYNCTYGLVF